MRSGDHKYNVHFLIKLKEKAPGADSISPGLGMEAFQFLDIRTKMRVLSQLGIDNIAEFLCDLGLPGFGYLPKVLLKLVGFKDPVLIQRTPLSWLWRPLTRF